MHTAVMMEQKQEEDLHKLCSTVRTLVSNGEYNECTTMISKAMGEHPHNPEPHNLLGIVLEHTGNHCAAMKHFRAAWALDPTYAPASQNLNNYGTFYSNGRCAYDESDCEIKEYTHYAVEYDDRGVGHMIRRKK